MPGDPRPVDLPPADFTLLGRPLHFGTLSPEVHGWLERTWRRDEHAPEHHPYRIVLEEHGGPPAAADAPGWAPVEVRLPDGLSLHWASRGSAWRWGGPESGAVARFDTEGARIGVWGAAVDGGAPAAARADAGDGASGGPASPPPGWRVALYVAFCEALRASGLLPLHAAVVVRGGKATALAAPSGTGKTTTLVRLLSQGWRPLAEDLSWLDPADGTLYGWDRGLRLWPDGVERLGPTLAAAPWTVDPDGKRFLAWDALGVTRVPQARLARWILLERDAARPSAYDALPRRDAVRALWESTGVPMTRGARDAVGAHVAVLLQRLEFRRLRLGSTPIPPL